MLKEAVSKTKKRLWLISPPLFVTAWLNRTKLTDTILTWDGKDEAGLE